MRPFPSVKRMDGLELSVCDSGLREHGQILAVGELNEIV